MRCLNEPIAREANREDKVTGKFWESRYTSQALLDEKALAACMVYVDLNPIRAQMANTPESSKHTSVQHRIDRTRRTRQPNRIDQQPQQLLPFAGNPRNDMPAGLPFCLTDYLELVDWSGRILREDKKGAIPAESPQYCNVCRSTPATGATLQVTSNTRSNTWWARHIMCAVPVWHSVNAGYRASVSVNVCFPAVSPPTDYQFGLSV
jgi:hypothetical protein